MGKENVIRQLVIALIAGGTCFWRTFPAQEKTMLLRAFAKSIGGDFKRIQFTPDLLPSDLTGINFFHQQKGGLAFRPGSIFSNIVLADEINRATPRSQSALLEVMEEKQVTVDGATYPMAEPYMVMARQNPIGSFGTFPLPEAQLDRFFMRLSLGYMTREQEIAVMSRPDSRELLEKLTQVADAETLAGLRREYRKVRVSDAVMSYIRSGAFTRWASSIWKRAVSWAFARR